MIGAEWSEIDQRAKTPTWTIPAKRMKAGKQHRVPLCDRALAILSTLPREHDNPFVFIGGATGKPLHSVAMLQGAEGDAPRPDGARFPLSVPRLGGGTD